jgi:hypothetical protein
MAKTNTSRIYYVCTLQSLRKSLQNWTIYYTLWAYVNTCHNKLKMFARKNTRDLRTIRVCQKRYILQTYFQVFVVFAFNPTSLFQTLHKPVARVVVFVFTRNANTSVISRTRIKPNLCIQYCCAFRGLLNYFPYLLYAHKEQTKCFTTHLLIWVRPNLSITPCTYIYIIGRAVL